MGSRGGEEEEAGWSALTGDERTRAEGQGSGTETEPEREGTAAVGGGCDVAAGGQEGGGSEVAGSIRAVGSEGRVAGSEGSRAGERVGTEVEGRRERVVAR
jgi:hypothetical protein